MKRSNILTSARTFGRRVKARLNQILQLEGEQFTEATRKEATNVNVQHEGEIMYSDGWMNEILYDHDTSGDESCGDDDDDYSSDDDDDASSGDESKHYNSESTLEIKLWKWAVERKITLAALSELLKILRPHVDSQLPIDARTLLKTPPSLDIQEVAGGKFWQSGLRENLLMLCKHKKCPDKLKLMVSIDGIKPASSSVEEFWPIQCAVDEVDMEPFFVRVWFGEHKPPIEEFLRPFVNELLLLLEEGLICVENNKVYDIEVYMFVCDAPARAYLKCIKGHGGYFSCERCTEEGDYVSDHVCLIRTTASLRTDTSFRSREQPEHHWSTSPLEDLPIDMVRSFPLDYLHLILLGVMKTLLIFWTRGAATYSTKFSATDIRQIAVKIMEARKTQPKDINRKCRPLAYLRLWKGTEFRTFLLKVGPAVLKDHLTAEAFNHFLALHCAVTICTTKSLLKYANIAKALFTQFVERFSEIYGDERYTYNIHSLIHVVDDIERYGALDKHSAFRYETNLGVLKSLLRSGHKPLEQIAKRLIERQYMYTCVPDDSGPLKKFPYLSNSHKKLHFENTYLDASDRNCWMLTTTENIVRVRHFSKNADGISIHGFLQDKALQKCLYEQPLNSENLCIYKCTEKLIRVVLKVADFKCKMFKINLGNNEDAFFPLYHTEQ